MRPATRVRLFFTSCFRDHYRGCYEVVLFDFEMERDLRVDFEDMTLKVRVCGRGEGGVSHCRSSYKVLLHM